MKCFLFVLIGGLVVWFFILLYDLAMAEAVHIGFSTLKMAIIFWLTIAITVFNELFKEVK